jgi:hypothetical protein
MAAVKKVHRGYIYTTDGRTIKVQPENGKKFELKELQKAVGGYIESLIPGIKGCKQLYANEDGISLGLAPNPHTQNVVNMRVYRLNGYGENFRVLGDIIAVLSEPVEENAFPTISQVV